MWGIVRNGSAVSLVLAAAACAADALRYEPVAAGAPGVGRAEATTRSVAGAKPIRVWIYRPRADAPAGGWPCVLVAPGGTNGAIGVRLDEADVAEHLPYALRGFIVVAFDVDGAIARGARVEDYGAAARAFVAADGGLASLRAALDVALATEPAIDARRVYVAGHGSGGTLALRAAATLPAVRGVVAYAPLVDPARALDADTLDAFDALAPGTRALLADRQPVALAASIAAPTMLFGAADDDRAPIADTRRLADAMLAAGNAPLVVEVGAGGHVNALFARGLDAGAAWLEDRARRDGAARVDGPATVR